MDEPAGGTIEFRGYRLEPVLGRLSPDQRREVVAMWLAAGALPPAEAERRAGEVVVAIRNPTGAIAGVNTAYVQDVPGVGPYWFYRTFIRPADRGVSGLPTRALRSAIALLREHPDPRRPRGVIAVVENPKLEGRAVARRMERLGLHLLGQNAHDQHVWCLKFDGSVPVPPPGVLRPIDD